jgi:hypothetical protein
MLHCVPATQNNPVLDEVGVGAQTVKVLTYLEPPAVHTTNLASC